MTVEQQAPPSAEDILRERALKRLKKRREFHAHLIVYVLFNSFFVGIWAITGSGFFWPMFILAGWGIGLVMNAWDVYRGEEFSESQIRAEMDRLSRPSGKF
jgi:hypothetical protein